MCFIYIFQRIKVIEAPQSTLNTRFFLLTIKLNSKAGDDTEFNDEII